MFSMFGPVISIIKNTKAGTFHPIVFVESPLPGPPAADKPVRHKSKMHHTTGFPTRGEALADIPNLVGAVKEHAIGPVRVWTEEDFEWDGDGIPATVHFFPSDVLESA